MRLVARIFLFVFIAFLSTPIIVTLLEKSSDTSIYFNMSDEEEQVQKEIKDLAFMVSFQVPFRLKRTIIKSSLILSENLSKQDKVSRSIFSPPPDRA